MELRCLGQYRLLAPLNVPSATCRFFLARHEGEPDDERPGYVAKLLDPQRGADAARRQGQFAHEIRLLRAFNHPGIPTVHAAGEQDGVAYAVMDRVEGIDLATLLGHRGPDGQLAPPSRGTVRPLSREVAVYIMGQLADALRYLHTLEYMENEEPTPLGVLHRNICPSNVLVSRAGDVILTGFGCTTSRWLEPEHDDPMAGDLAYMAPERVSDGGRATEQTELFALAVILWEMLRGERCLAGDDERATREAIMRFDISQASRRVSGLSVKLSEIVRKNLDRDPGRRYEDAFHMLQRLAQSPEAAAAERARAQLSQLVSAFVASPAFAEPSVSA